MKINSKTTIALAGLLIFALASPALAKGYQSRTNNSQNTTCTEEQRAVNQTKRDARRAENRSNCANKETCTLTEEQRAQKQAENRANRPGMKNRKGNSNSRTN